MPPRGLCGQRCLAQGSHSGKINDYHVWGSGLDSEVRFIFPLSSKLLGNSSLDQKMLSSLSLEVHWSAKAVSRPHPNDRGKSIVLCCLTERFHCKRALSL